MLERAATLVGLDASTAIPVRTGAHNIFELRGGIIARIGKPGTADTARRELRIARWLNRSGIPAVEPDEALSQPIVVDDRPVTWWQLIGDHRAATPAELGSALAGLHALDPPTTFELPEYQPFIGLADRIRAATTIGHDDQQWLTEHYEAIRRRYEQLPATDRTSVIHGDAWQGNLVVPASGTPIFLDLDKVSVGRPEWDLVQLAVDHTDFTRLDANDYDSFVTAYGGYDMTTTPEFRIYADIQELRWTAFAISLSHDNRAAAAEAAHRIACLRGRIPKPWQWCAL
ncbi:aminoglycoside phosphotransferase family protein [Nocardia cyriacigeorgica]|nr:aminoglycoside phosphotransferase family protein [Nocardia cyriacigeorgica]MBF6454425.1 aminoglycoside phosphotransferase family protein [Nocardia cyriacigeorgica]MBF6478091.1 aminoglycoside phosphotransferase family protein [Nocardia cyriacigeorgica]MBF6552319.1 aminoglycoside phosphotransferase family protein [Nocardia cyriacigeorgica]